MPGHLTEPCPEDAQLGCLPHGGILGVGSVEAPRAQTAGSPGRLNKEPGLWECGGKGACPSQEDSALPLILTGEMSGKVTLKEWQRGQEQRGNTIGVAETRRHPPCR